VSRDDVEERGLSGTIGPSDADDLRFVDGERDPIERSKLSEAFSDIRRNES
jgi:hypothetical protein